MRLSQEAEDRLNQFFDSMSRVQKKHDQERAIALIESRLYAVNYEQGYSDGIEHILEQLKKALEWGQ